MNPSIAALALIGLLLWAGDARSQTAEPDTVRVGDRWSYDLKDAATGDLRQSFTLVVFEVNGKEIMARAIVKGQELRPQTAVYDLDWGLIDNGTWQYRPSEIGIKKPLHIGKEWRWDVSAKNMRDGSAGRTTGVAKVTGEEKVTTAAGTFDTFRIEAKGRQVSLRDQRSATITYVFWYAPTVNRWVKRTFEAHSGGRSRDSISEELTGYSRKP
jgi:hypothetical protein